MKNDTVTVIKGRERGKRGKALRVFPKEGRIIIEGVNVIKKHMKKRRQQDQPGIIEKEGPLNISNVLFYCPKCKKGVRVGVKRKDKKLSRFCRKCKQEI